MHNCTFKPSVEQNRQFSNVVSLFNITFLLSKGYTIVNHTCNFWKMGSLEFTRTIPYSLILLQREGRQQGLQERQCLQKGFQQREGRQQGLQQHDGLQQGFQQRQGLQFSLNLKGKI